MNHVFISNYIHSLVSTSRPWDDFFSPQTFALPTTPINLTSEYYRVKINVSSFRSNYTLLLSPCIVLTVFYNWDLFLCTLFTSLTVAAIAIGNKFFTDRRGSPLVIQGRVVTSSYRNLSFLFGLFYFWLFSCLRTFTLLVLFCTCFISLHAIFRASPPVSNVSNYKNYIIPPSSSNSKNVDSPVPTTSSDKLVSQQEQGVQPEEKILVDKDWETVTIRARVGNNNFPGSVQSTFSGGVRKKSE